MAPVVNLCDVSQAVRVQKMSRKVAASGSDNTKPPWALKIYYGAQQFQDSPALGGEAYLGFRSPTARLLDVVPRTGKSAIAR
jgi:hypothetical protein